MKPSKKARKKLDARIADYERTVATSKLGREAFTRPGSMKIPGK